MIIDDKEHFIQYKEYLENSSNAISPVLTIKEPKYSLSMGDENLSTISETESDEVIKSRVKSLVPIPSESEDESSPIFTAFSNSLFDCNDDFTSSDDESLSNEDVLMENFKIYSNSLFDDEEIISNKIDPHYFNVESNLIESLPNRDTLFDSSPKFDYLEEFSDVEVFFEPDLGVLTTKVVKGISEHYVFMLNILPTLPTFDPIYPVYDTLLPFLSKNKDKVFKPGILSYLLVSHRDKITFDFSENPMMMYEGDIPLLDVLYLHFYSP
nr:hypothetical protein [Tanacetum cinerariifolium]